MNCLEYRRRLLIDPRDGDQRLTRHRHQCRACADHTVKQAGFESDLEKAFMIEPPGDLEPTILLARGFDELPRRAHRRPRVEALLAIAAGLMLAVIVAGTVLSPPWDQSLPTAVVAEATLDRQQRASGNEISLQRVNQVLRPLGVALGAPALDSVVFADLCQIRKRTAAHIMVASGDDVVSALVMPGQKVAARTRLRGPGLTGVLMPIPGGSLALVAKSGVALEALEMTLRDTLRVDVAGESSF